MQHIKPLLIISLLAFTSLSGCISNEESSDAMVLATTTSMRDSGLLDELIPAFTEEFDIEVDIIAVGTGAALNLGKNKDADLLIVHAPEKEMEFIANGYAENRTTFAWNRFVILSPEPTQETDLLELLNTINANEDCFISRGDNSGTHVKEQELWISASQEHEISLIEEGGYTRPSGEWYYSIGQGMGAAITMADEKNCYTLSDKGTTLSRANIDLNMVEFDDNLTINPYSAIPIDGDGYGQARLFVEFLLGDESKEIIDRYSINGQPLFTYGDP